MTDINTTLSERRARYGDFSTHACIAWDIKNAIHAADSWDALPYVHKQALDVIADKIARILNGDPNYADNWHDIQGYARLVEEHLLNAALDPSFNATLHEVPVGNGGGISNGA